MNISIVCPGTLFPASVGILEAFDSQDVRIEHLTTTSLASVPCAFYCNGRSMRELLGLVDDLSPLPLTRTWWSILNSYYTPHFDLNIDSIVNKLPDHCGQLHIPLSIITLNNDTGFLTKHSLDTEHHLPTVVKAASSIAPLMRPVTHNKQRHSDASCCPIDYKTTFNSFVVLVQSTSNNSEYKHPNMQSRDLYMQLATTFQHSTPLVDIVVNIDRYPIDPKQLSSQSDSIVKSAYDQTYKQLLSLKRQRKVQ